MNEHKDCSAGSNELLSCPFCGGEPELNCGGPGNWWVRCKSCKAASDDRMRHVAIEAWNARSGGAAQPTGMREALRAAKCHLITLGGDPRPSADEGSDEIQIAVLDVIDAALATQSPDTAVEREPCYSTIETCFDCGVREPCDEDCPNHVEPEPVSRSSAQPTKLPCDVMLPPFTIVRKGCELSALMTALQIREKDPLYCPHFAPTVRVTAQPPAAPVKCSSCNGSGYINQGEGIDCPDCWKPPAARSSAASEPVAYQFRQRSAVGKGPQSSLPWCDWICIEREDYERYLREPNKLVQVRPLYASEPQEAWQPAETRPRDLFATYLIANAKGQVAPCIRGIIHNNVGTAWDWEYGEAVTAWMPMPTYSVTRPHGATP